MRRILLFSFACSAVVLACAANQASSFDDEEAEASASSSSAGGAEASSSSSGNGGLDFSSAGSGSCATSCGSDYKTIVDCNGVLVQECTGKTACDPSTLTCKNACDVAVATKQSVGCEYYATDMHSYKPGACFAAFVANTWNEPVKIEVELNGQALNTETFTRIPSGQGPNLSYAPYNAATGLPPGEVAILFLSAGNDNVICPAPAAAGDVGLAGTGIGNSFRIRTDVPVVAYQINPFGGGSAAVTGASLLLPTSAWDTNYIAVNAYGYDLAPPSLNIVAAEDNTEVTMVPVAAVAGGAGIPAGAANTPLTFLLNAGQQAQISQNAELTGSVISSSKPVGLMAGSPCMRTPKGVAYCDHGEQMVPPIRALGSEYVAVQHRPRSNEPAIWRLIGAVDGTQLTYSSAVGGPATLARGQIVEIVSPTPFVVSSQDADHPFLMFAYMSGSQWSMLSDTSGHGDVDFSVVVPPSQFMQQYVFFTDPTYPETNLVVIRAKKNDAFFDVTLDCAGKLSNWTTLGDYQWTRVDLITGDFQNVGSCSTGRREMSSDGPFGVHVWGWGTPLTSSFTANVSYSYPAGMNIQFVNDVVIPPIPN